MFYHINNLKMYTCHLYQMKLNYFYRNSLDSCPTLKFKWLNSAQKFRVTFCLCFVTPLALLVTRADLKPNLTYTTLFIDVKIPKTWCQNTNDLLVYLPSLYECVHLRFVHFCGEKNVLTCICMRRYCWSNFAIIKTQTSLKDKSYIFITELLQQSLTMFFHVKCL